MRVWAPPRKGKGKGTAPRRGRPFFLSSESQRTSAPRCPESKNQEQHHNLIAAQPLGAQARALYSHELTWRLSPQRAL